MCLTDPEALVLSFSAMCVNCVRTWPWAVRPVPAPSCLIPSSFQGEGRGEGEAPSGAGGHPRTGPAWLSLQPGVLC